MCLLVLEDKQTTKHLTQDEFNTAWRANSDGFWILINSNWKNYVRKTKNKEQAWNWYKKITETYHYNFIVYHFRLGTSGGLGENMLHPFPLGDDKWLFHNWVLPFYANDKSDTALLADVLAKLNKQWVCPIKDEVVMEMLDNLSSGYNKLLLVWPNEYIIHNEKAGHWKSLTWLSNSTYVSYKNNYCGFDLDDDWIWKKIYE